MSDILFDALSTYFLELGSEERVCYIVRSNGRVYALALDNVSQHRRGLFMANPAMHIAIVRLNVDPDKDFTVLGRCHSHPDGPPSPSLYDIQSANYDQLELIYSIPDRKFVAYVPEDAPSVEVPRTGEVRRSLNSTGTTSSITMVSIADALRFLTSSCEVHPHVLDSSNWMRWDW